MQTIRSFRLVLICLMFSCRALQGDWSAPVDITPAGDFSNQPKLAVFANGGAVAAYRNFDTDSIQARILTPCSNIWTPTDDVVAGAVSDPVVAADADGNAVVLWLFPSGADTILQGATLAAGSLTWVPTTDLTSTGTVGDQVVVMNGAGDAVAVWKDVINNTIQAATLAAGSSVWVPATGQLSPPLENASFPQVAIDPAGNAVAVWQVFDGLTAVIQGAILAAGSNTWVSTTDLTTGVDFVNVPFVTVDADGNALAIWTATDAFFNIAIQAARLPFGSTVWVPINDVVPFQGFGLGSTRLAMNLSGEAIAIWTEFGISASVRSSILPAGSSAWVPTDLFVPDSGTGRVAIDPAGNAVATYEVFNGTFNFIQAASLPFGSLNWIDFTDLSSIQSFDSSVGKDNFGNTVAVWGAFNNINSFGQASVNLASNAFDSTVVASPTSVPADGVTPSTITVTLRDCAGQPLVGHAVSLTALNGSSVISPPSGLSNALGQVTFTVTDAVAEIVTYQARDTTDGITIEQTATVQFGVGPLPPSNFHAKVLPDPCHRCLRLNLLTWCPSPDPTVVSYRIYENGQVIATTGRKVHAAIIPIRLPNVSYTYSLVAVNAAGEESTPLTITTSAQPQSSSCEVSCRCRCR